MTDWYRPRGSTARDGYELAISPGEPGWEHTGLNVATLGPGGSRTIETGDCEWIVLPLSGAATVEVGGETVRLEGRSDVFAGPSDIAYVPRATTVTVTSAEGARIAFPHARAASSYPFRKLDAADVRSSYPPHKHDEQRPGEESALEEIYYFELRSEDGAEGNDPVGYQRVYGTADRPIDVLAEVRSGDVVLVPHGWHGPAMAPPGYDLYYLNVMAGPGAERAWLICDDPRHAWVRGTWAAQKVDSRLPYGGRR